MSVRGGSAAHVGAGHGSGSFRSRPAFSSRSSFRGSNFRRPLNSRGFNNFRGPRIRNFGFRNRCLNGFCRGRAFPWWYAGAFDPYWWWDSGSSYDEDREREIATANQMNQQSLEEQRMRQEGDRDADERPLAQPARRGEPAAVDSATVLVYRDQHKKEIQNYAIVGQTLWNFAPQRTERIPLSDLDLPATAKVNADRGVDFRVPGSPEGQ